MDQLYFKTTNKEALLNELGLPLDMPTFYDSGNDWILHWIGKIPQSTEVINEGTEDEEVLVEWQEGEFFNVYLKGQSNMDFFTKSVKSAVQILPEPNTPNYTLL